MLTTVVVKAAMVLNPRDEIRTAASRLCNELGIHANLPGWTTVLRGHANPIARPFRLAKCPWAAQKPVTVSWFTAAYRSTGLTGTASTGRRVTSLLSGTAAERTPNAATSARLIHSPG